MLQVNSYVGWSFCLACLFAVTTTSGQQKADKALEQEPPLNFTIEIGGKKIKGQVGKPIKLPGTHKDASIKVTTDEFRTFNKAGIEFPYPEKFSWTADVSVPTNRAWTMTGAECALSIFLVSGDYTAGDYAKELVEEFAADEFDEEDVVIKLGQKEYDAIRLIFEVDDVEFIYDVILLPKLGGDSRLMLLEELAPDRYPDSEEVKKAMSYLNKGFRLKPKK